MTLLVITHKNGDIFDIHSGIDIDLKSSKKKMYVDFLLKTKLPLPTNLSKESKLKHFYILIFEDN